MQLNISNYLKNNKFFKIFSINILREYRENFGFSLSPSSELLILVLYFIIDLIK